MLTKYQRKTLVKDTFQDLKESYPQLRGYVELHELMRVHVLYHPIEEARELIEEGKIRYRKENGNVEINAQDFLWFAAESQVVGGFRECEGEDCYAEPMESGDGHLTYELEERKSAVSFPGPFSNGW